MKAEVLGVVIFLIPVCLFAYLAYSMSIWWLFPFLLIGIPGLIGWGIFSGLVGRMINEHLLDRGWSD